MGVECLHPAVVISLFTAFTAWCRDPKKMRSCIELASQVHGFQEALDITIAALTAFATRRTSDRPRLSPSKNKRLRCTVSTIESREIAWMARDPSP